MAVAATYEEPRCSRSGMRWVSSTGSSPWTRKPQVCLLVAILRVRGPSVAITQVGAAGVYGHPTRDSAITISILPFNGEPGRRELLRPKRCGDDAE